MFGVPDKIYIDIETFSSEKLAETGVYRYSESPDFDILLFGYSWNFEPVHVVDLLHGEPLPQDVLSALTDPTIIKVAHNANFERVCLSRYLGLPHNEFLPPEQWHCSMIHAAYCGLPLSLEQCGSVLGIEKAKLSAGKDLIRRYCMPCTPCAANDYVHRIRSRPDDPTYQLFIEYNRTDVYAEMEIERKLCNYPVPQSVWEEYWLDQRINDRGIRIDTDFVRHAIAMDEASKAELTAELRALTGLTNANSLPQLKAWLAAHGVQCASLDKAAIEALRSTITDATVLRVLELRQMLGKSSVSKYRRMLSSVCADGRARGAFQFYGTHTGRFSGKLIMLHNLPQTKLADLDEARALVLAGDHAALKQRYGNVPDVLSQLIRTAFIPAEGKKFVVCDYSAIEARVLAWLAGDEERLKVFADGGDIYSVTASKMFGVPVSKHGPNAHLRQKGKICELALGYQGGVGALQRMNAAAYGVKEEEFAALVDAWRCKNVKIVLFWAEMNSAARTAVSMRTTRPRGPVVFRYRAGMLSVTLPSGRHLYYVRPRCIKDEAGKEVLTYSGLTPARRWGEVATYGGRLTENIVQGVARDLLLCAMANIEGNVPGAGIVMTVHDEVVVECDDDVTLEEIRSEMNTPPRWATDLPLDSDGFECAYYKKD